jgi:alpha-glucosidase (family GH31 glycosyl hydrolase)
LFDVHSPPVEGGRTISVGLTLSSIPAFVKAGSIIPLKITKRASTLHMRDDPISFAVWPCTEGKATGFLYLDDEESMAFHESQDFALLRADFANRELTLTRIKGRRSLLNTFLAQIIVAGQDGTNYAKVKNVEELSTSVSLARILGEHTIADVRIHLAEL